MTSKRLELPLWFVLHHSASNSLGVGINTLKAERMRRNEGYNIIIDLDEKTGKVNFSQDVPDDQISNGTFGINPIALNICINGNFEERELTKDEIQCVVQVLAVKMRKFGCHDVNAIVGHYYAGTHLSNVKYITACPGKHYIDKIPEIRKLVATYLNGKKEHVN